MSREIIFQKKSSGKFTIAGETKPNDPFLERLVKLVPADVISVYLAVFTVINNQAKGNIDALQWIVFAVVAVVLPFYLQKLGKVKSTKQIIICEISFLIWVFSMGGPVKGLDLLGFSTQLLAAILTPLFTLAAPWLAFMDNETPPPPPQTQP
jgi:hypothetical protein